MLDTEHGDAIRHHFFAASCKWGYADRHAVRCELEKVPDTTETSELAFKCGREWLIAAELF